MSVKRQATSELNHENWDQDDPSEQDEIGQFKTAPKEVLEKRVIRTAKRRVTAAKDDEPKKTVFSGFGGFNKPPPSSFDFLANLTNGNKTNGAASKTNTEQQNSSVFNSKNQSTSLFTSTSTPFGKTIFGANPSQTSIQGCSDNVTESTSKTDTSFSDSSFKSQSTLKSTKSTQANTIFSVAPVTTSQVTSPFGIANASATTNSLFSLSNNSPFKINQPATSIASKISEVSKPTNTLEKSEEKIEDKKIKYYTKLKGLNESVSDWIKKHVEETPLCILTPIFKDYEKYLKEIQDEYNNSDEKASDSVSKDSDSKSESKPNTVTKTGTFGNTSSVNSTSTPKPLASSTGRLSKTDTSPAGKTTGFSFGINSASTNPTTSFPSFTTNTNATTTSVGFSFGIKPQQTTTTASSHPPTNTNTNTTSSSLFTLPSNTTSSSKPFSFSADKPFSFNSKIQKPAEEKKEDNENEEEDEPPKVEFTPVVEENSVYDKRCKIFVKKDGNFIDKGVGTLYIKKVEEKSKHQLLVRANTNLGNVLLNLMLTSSIPTQRLGKNNVMMVCIPTPESKPPPTPVLIRVKTSEEADELLETLNKYKV